MRGGLDVELRSRDDRAVVRANIRSAGVGSPQVDPAQPIAFASVATVDSPAVKQFPYCP